MYLHFSKKIYIFLTLISIISIGCSSKSRTWTNPYDPESPNFKASISGTVKNIAGEAINGVTITTYETTTTRKTATTNSNGAYSIDNLSIPTGLYTLTVTKTGYTSTSGTAYPMGTKNFILKISGWTGSYFSGSFACNFTSTGPSVGTADSNTDFDYDGTNLTTPYMAQGILSLGTISSLDSIGTVTTNSYTYGAVTTTSNVYSGSVKAYAGNCYAIKTIEGNYVKIRITSLLSSSQQVYFDSVYQSNGTPQF